MKKKYVFVDLDGTILDYNTHSVPDSAKEAIRRARANGHELVLTTGRPPCLFYGIDKELGFTSYIAANGRVVVDRGEVIFDAPIPEETIDSLVAIAHKERFDIAYEGMDNFVLESAYETLYQQFCDHFNLGYPTLEPGYYKGRRIYQISLFYDRSDYKRFETLLPELSFEFSCRYGLDVNTPGGHKEVGIKAFVLHHQLDLSDVIAIGDGYNDISMLQYAPTSVAMGNAYDGVKEHATFTTKRIEEDGLYWAFEQLRLI
jgi:Cof subfamily protein (haloacid dehalogenase superfamily)